MSGGSKIFLILKVYFFLDRRFLGRFHGRVRVSFPFSYLLGFFYKFQPPPVSGKAQYALIPAGGLGCTKLIPSSPFNLA